MDLRMDVLAMGGVAVAHELLALGHSPEAVRLACKSGEVVRPRKGWYAHPSVGQPAIEAIRIGGRLACCSAATHHGLWVPDHTGLHVEVTANASRLRSRGDHRTRLAGRPDPGVVVHWATTTSKGDRRSTCVTDAIAETYRCLGAREGFVVMESAMRLKLLDGVERRQLVAALPRRMRALAERADGMSDSGTESMVRLGLLSLHIRFRQQVGIAGVGRVDFLIGERLIVEVDSRAHHSDPYRDRRRDAELGVRGYRVLRFMYAQIVHEWPMVEAAILAAMSRGDHLPA